jgi:hypothetical protein
MFAGAADADKGMDKQTFTDFIQSQLKLYVQRQIASAMLEAQTNSSSKDSAGCFTK